MAININSAKTLKVTAKPVALGTLYTVTMPDGLHITTTNTEQLLALLKISGCRSIEIEAAHG